MNEFLSGDGAIAEIDPQGLLAIIPAHNEAATIAQVVEDTLPFLPVLVVNDGSSDETSYAARSAGAVVLDCDPNRGKGAALRAGFRWALQRDMKAVITLDGDGQHDPAEITKFIEKYQESSSDLILGKRQTRHMPIIRLIANNLGRAIMAMALGQDGGDNQSGYRLISARLMEKSVVLQNDGFEFEVEMVADCLRHGYRLDSVPIRTIYTGGGSHISPLRHLTGFLAVTWRIWRRRSQPV